MIRPVKSLGQNFLRDENILRKITAEIDPKAGDSIIEIGPGEGALTKHLLNSEAALTFIEYDIRAVEHLKMTYPDINIIHKDFLKFELSSLDQNKLRIVGNIPYNITSPIIFKMLENRDIVEDSILMTQYEVAKRIMEYWLFYLILLLKQNYVLRFHPMYFIQNPKLIRQ